jgi:hypothetical protein
MESDNAFLLTNPKPIFDWAWESFLKLSTFVNALFCIIQYYLKKKKKKKTAILYVYLTSESQTKGPLSCCRAQSYRARAVVVGSGRG